jgi:hypothetical protein
MMMTLCLQQVLWLLTLIEGEGWDDQQEVPKVGRHKGQSLGHAQDDDGVEDIPKGVAW